MSARFWRLARRIGKKTALVAIAHSIVIAIWHIHTEHVDYNDLGVEWRARHSDPHAEADRLVRRLTALGHRLTIEPAA